MIGSIRPEQSYQILDTRKNIVRDTSFEVVTRINDSCNLRCTYCHWNKHIHYDLNVWEKVHDKLFTILDKHLGESILLAIHGGEAYTHPNFDYFVKILTSMKKRYRLTVNYMTNNTFQLCPDVFDVLDVTLHINELCKHSLIDRFFRNLEIYKDRVNSVDVMLEHISDKFLYEEK